MPGPDPATQLYAAPRPRAELLIRAAHVVDPRAGLDGPHDVLVRDGEIAQLGAPHSLSAPVGAETVDGSARYLFPAFVDPHVHLRSPGQEYKEDITTGTAAAAAGGYCAVVAMPNTSPTVDTAAVVESLVARARAQARIPTGFLAAITRGLHGDELTEMAELRDAGAIGFTDDGRPVVSAGMLRKALQYQRLAGGIIALHEEDPALSGAGVMHEGAVSARLGMAGIPSVSESTMVARDAALARYEGARVHFQHLSCAESVEVLAAARQAGPPALVSGEASPHHLTLTDDAVLGLDSRFKMNPPLRAESDRRALVEALRSGVIDCVATDHAPHARHEKEVPFEEASMGTTGSETAFAALYTELVIPGTLALSVLIARMTAGGGLYGLPIPRIAPGEPANLALVDLEATWTVGEDGYASRSENCCFAGRRLSGRVLLTVAGGVVAHRRPMLAPDSDLADADPSDPSDPSDPANRSQSTSANATTAATR
jgi:dihydroorotase